MATFTRRLLPILFSGLLLVPLAGTVAAVDLPPPADDAALLQDGVDLVHMTNAKRESVGRVDLRMDPALMSIARDRARVMAANDVLSHTEPDGTTVWDRINAAHITWYGGGEIIAWNHYPAVYSTAEAISAWWGSPGHHAIMVSTGYNYVGFGAAVSADGKFYFAGVFAKLPDHTVPWARMGSVSMRTVDATPQAGDRPLVGRRHPPAGPDLRSPLFPGPVARRRRQSGTPGRRAPPRASRSPWCAASATRSASGRAIMPATGAHGGWSASGPDPRARRRHARLAPRESRGPTADIVWIVRIVRRSRTFQLHRTDGPGRARSTPSSRDTTR